MKLDEQTNKLDNLAKFIARELEHFIKSTEKANSVEITIKWSKDSVPTVSYTVDGFPLILKEESDASN